VDDSAGDSAREFGLCHFESFGGVRLLARGNRRFDLLDEGADAADSRVVDRLARRVAADALLGLRRVRNSVEVLVSMKNGAANRLAPKRRFP
jgi:hypothetical protein